MDNRSDAPDDSMFRRIDRTIKFVNAPDHTDKNDSATVKVVFTAI